MKLARYGDSGAEKPALVDADGRTVDEIFAEFEVRAVDLNTGEFVDDVDVTTYDRGSSQIDVEFDVTKKRRWTASVGAETFSPRATSAPRSAVASRVSSRRSTASPAVPGGSSGW